MLVLIWCKVVYAPMMKSSTFILINISGFAHIQQIIVQDQNCTCSLQWPIFCPSPLKLLCSKAKIKQYSKKKKRLQVPGNFPSTPHAAKVTSRWSWTLHLALFAFSSPFPLPPLKYLLICFIAFTSIALSPWIFIRLWVSRSRKGDWMWVWVWQGPVALSGR